MPYNNKCSIPSPITSAKRTNLWASVQYRLLRTSVKTAGDRLFLHGFHQGNEKYSSTISGRSFKLNGPYSMGMSKAFQGAPTENRWRFADLDVKQPAAFCLFRQTPTVPTIEHKLDEVKSVRFIDANCLSCCLGTSAALAGGKLHLALRGSACSAASSALGKSNESHQTTQCLHVVRISLSWCPFQTLCRCLHQWVWTSGLLSNI